MGIKGLSQFLKKKVPVVYDTNVNLYEFQHTVWAIDANIYFHKALYIYQDRWLEYFIQLIDVLWRYNIHPVFVIDYKEKVPIEKEAEQRRRRDQMANQKKKVLSLKKSLESYIETHVCTNELEEFYLKRCKLRKKNNNQNQKLISSWLSTGDKDDNGSLQDLLNPSHMSHMSHLSNLSNKSKTTRDIYIDVGFVKQELDNMQQQVLHVTDEHVEQLISFCEILDVPCFKGLAEAETTCALMYHWKLCDVIMTVDTDIFIYYPFIVCNGVNLNGTCDVVYSHLIPRHLGLSISQFRDFAILCGTDYNEKIKNVGCVKAYNFLKTHGSLELMEKKKYLANQTWIS